MRFSVMPPHGPLRRWGLYRITLVVVSKVVRRVSRRAGRTGSRSRSEQSARAAFFGVAVTVVVPVRIQPRLSLLCFRSCFSTFPLRGTRV